MPHRLAITACRSLAVVALTILSWPALAQDRDICLQRAGQQSIDACSRLLSAGQLAGKDLATIYVLRATIYRTNQQYALAIDDLTHAIGLLKAAAPNEVVASAYVTRGSVYVLAGNPSAALADYRQALAIDASNAQAAEGVRDLQAQVASTEAAPAGSNQFAQLPIPNEPLPADIPVPANVLDIIQTHPFFANAPPVRVGGYSYLQLTSNRVNGFSGGTSMTYDTSVKWLKQGIIHEQSIWQSETTYNVTTRMRSKQSYIGAANGLVSLGYLNAATTYAPGIKPISSVSKNAIESLTNLQGSIFPLRVGNRFSWQGTYRSVIPPTLDDELTETELCEFSQSYDARSFHPDLTGLAYLETCQDQMVYKRNKTMDTIGVSKTLFFGDLGIAIRVDPQNPPQRVIQTYFQNETVETARLQSFLMAR